MLDCGLCNYCKALGSNAAGMKISKCELTGFTFNQRIENLEIEYPCLNVNFERIEMKTKVSLEIEYDELKLA